MPCQSPHRSAYSAKHWRCHGVGLVTVMRHTELGAPLPIVAPRWSVRLIMSLLAPSPYLPEPFTGGDHLHLVLPTHPLIKATLLALRGH
jgi:hypothetical protein